MRGYTSDSVPSAGLPDFAVPSEISSPGPSFPTEGGFDGFGGYGGSFLDQPIGRGRSNTPLDVFKVSSFLADNGYLDTAMRTADDNFFKSIEAFQLDINQRSGQSLSIDGVIKPFGPTEVMAQRGITGGAYRGRGAYTKTALHALPNQGRAQVFDPDSVREQ